MNAFPAGDPIPLPAPVWLFKALDVVTLSLHFMAVELLLGGLLVATWLALMGRRGSPTGELRLDAASRMAYRLPVIMTYVINLGVPPLLFLQVLYGRAIYTSSVLIGAWWIAVIPLLMLCYWLLYRFVAALETGKGAWWRGALAWLVAGSVAKIYTTNMTLMLRPEVWQGMYSASPAGVLLPPSDPTLMPRWWFMLAGGLVFAGLWMLWLSGGRQVQAAERGYLLSRGGRLALAAVILQLVAAHFVYHGQPESVRAALASHWFAWLPGCAWFAAMGLVALLAAWAGFARSVPPAASWLAVLAGFLASACMTLFRDSLRDLTLLGKGFDVWQRAVVTNWGVVCVFLALFVIGLATLGWLTSVMARATPVSEKVA